MGTLPTVDTDQHYYEPDDCCTRHLDPRFREHAVHVAADDDGQLESRIEDGPLAVERRPRQVTLAPGELAPILAAGERGDPYVPATISASAPGCTDRDTRLRLMDEWGIEAAVLFPSSGLGVDAQMEDCPDAASATATAFNRLDRGGPGLSLSGSPVCRPVHILTVGAVGRDGAEECTRPGRPAHPVRLGSVNGRSPAHPDFDLVLHDNAAKLLRL